MRKLALIISQKQLQLENHKMKNTNLLVLLFINYNLGK